MLNTNLDDGDDDSSDADADADDNADREWVGRGSGVFVGFNIIK